MWHTVSTTDSVVYNQNPFKRRWFSLSTTVMISSLILSMNCIEFIKSTLAFYIIWNYKGLIDVSSCIFEASVCIFHLFFTVKSFFTTNFFDTVWVLTEYYSDQICRRKWLKFWFKFFCSYSSITNQDRWNVRSLWTCHNSTEF